MRHSHRQPTTNPLSVPSILKIVTGAAITALNGSIVSRNISNIGSGNGSITSYISTTLSNGQSLPQGENYLLPPPPNYGNLTSQPFSNTYLSAIDLYNLPPVPNNSQLTPFFTDPLIAELERANSIQDLGNKTLKKHKKFLSHKPKFFKTKLQNWEIFQKQLYLPKL